MKKLNYLAGALCGLLVSFSTFSQDGGTDCASAVAASAGTITNTNGTDAWYTFVPPCDGSMTVASCGYGADTDVDIYSGACGAQTLLAAGGDNCELSPGGNNWASQATTAVVGGETYYIHWNLTYAPVGTWDLTYTPNSYNSVTSGVTSGEALLDWDDAAGATDYTVEYGVSGFVLGSGTQTTAPMSTLILSGLSPETSYDYYITVNGGACSLADGSYSFTTLPICDVPQNLAFTLIGDGTDSVAVTWDAGLTGETQWTFEWGTDGFALGTGTNSVVMDDSVMLTPADGIMGNTAYEYYVQAICGVDTLSYFVGPNEFTTSPTCLPTSNLNALATGTEALLSWDAGGTEAAWNIAYGETGFLLGVGGTTLNGVNTNLGTTISGLSPETTYSYYVQADCGGADGVSTWVGPFEFTTDIVCDVPTGLNITSLGETSATLGWAMGSATEWNIEYGEAGFMLGAGTAVNGLNTNSFDAPALTNGTDYSFYVQSVCGSTADSLSGWAGPFNFTTLVICAAPTNLDAINISNTSANVLWQAGSYETEWNVEWGITNFTQGGAGSLGTATHMDAVAPVNPYSITGLSPSSPTEYYVQAICGSTPDSLSTWVGPFSFNTQLANDEACNAIDIAVDGSVNVYHNEGATVNSDENNIAPASATYGSQSGWSGTAVPNNTVWFKFTAPAGGAVRVSTMNEFTTNFTEVAIYASADCASYNGFSLQGANGVFTFNLNGGGLLNPTTSTPGSRVDVCGLTAGTEYYVMVDSYTEVDTWSGNSTNVFNGPFGISVSELENPVAGTATPTDICAGDNIDLFTTITGNSSTDGVWSDTNFNPYGGSVLATTPTTTPGTYEFVYVVGGVCGSDTVTTSANIVEAPVAGNDGALESCNTTSIVLLNGLQGTVDLGGTWSDDDNTNQLQNGVVNANGLAAGTYNFTYTVAGLGSCSDASAVVTVTINDCAGIETESFETFTLFPNPSNGEFTINTTSTEVFDVVMTDLNGKVVFNGNNYSKTANLDVQSVETGIYFVNITSNGNTNTMRVVIK